MSTIACLNPRRCGAKTHMVGTAAAHACRPTRSPAPGTGPAAPPPPPGALTQEEVSDAERAGFNDPEVAAIARERLTAAMEGTEPRSNEREVVMAHRVWAVADIVEERLDADDAAIGWENDSGTPHPTGGYTEREVYVHDGMDTTIVGVVYHRADATGRMVAHREDGPAFVRYDVDGEVTHWQHSLHGRVHREDGPAEWTRGRANNNTGEVRFAYHDGDGHEGHGGSRWWEAVPGGVARCETLTGFGAEPDELARWVHYERLAGKRSTRRLLAAGVDARTAVGCAKAGVDDVEQVIAVARGDVPLSWAATGATA